MKKKLIAICIMFAFAFTMPAAQAVEPAYVSVEAPTVQDEDISKGNIATVAVTVNSERPYNVMQATIKETTSKDGWEDRYASIGAGFGGVSGGDSIGISKMS